MEGASYGVPPAPPLPTFLVQEKPPFCFTGLDYAGPLYVRVNGESEGKVWVALFTCCVTRAIHLDIFNHISLESFYRCLRWFIARRGQPRKIISDNVKTFKSAVKLLMKLESQVSIGHSPTGYHTQWVFNLEKASWWAGIFERLICSVISRRSLGEQS